MTSPHDRVIKLLSLALDPSTAAPEAGSAARVACRLIVRHDLLRGGCPGVVLPPDTPPGGVSAAAARPTPRTIFVGHQTLLCSHCDQALPPNTLGVLFDGRPWHQECWMATPLPSTG